MARWNPFSRPDRATYKQEIKRGLDRAFRAAPEQEVELDSARIIILSDHHKGARDGADDFQRCERAYNAALAYYLASGHRLVALGDVEELWECEPEEVMLSYPQTLALEAEFHRAGRYDRFFGNHDDLWAAPRQVRKHLGRLFPELSVREALKVRVTRQGSPVGLLFLAHGHQGTRESDRFAGISRLFVRHVWRPAQRKLRMASTTPAVDWELRGAHDSAMFEWARGHPEKPVLIAGHTHRPVFGESKPQPETERRSSEIEHELHEREASGATREELAELRAELEWARAEERRVRNQVPIDVSPPCYFNTGCCSFGDGDVTGLEIADGEIRLVRWPNREFEPAPLTLASDRLADVFGAVGARQPPGEEGSADPGPVPAAPASAAGVSTELRASPVGHDRLGESTEASVAEVVNEVTADQLSEEEAVDEARIEGDACEHASQEGRVASEEAEDFSTLAQEEIDALDELARAEDESRSIRTQAPGVSPHRFLEPGGDWGGSEAPVRRAIRIATRNGLTVTSTKRDILSSGSDHHVSQRTSFAADLSNGSSPTPEMDKTARVIARALGHPGWRGGVLTTSQGAARAQLLWRTTVGGNHFNHVHFGVRISGRVTPGMPSLTRPHMQGEEVRRIQRRLVELGFGPLEVDGVFGPDTDAAVRRFQAARDLDVDGVVGPRTREALG